MFHINVHSLAVVHEKQSEVHSSPPTLRWQKASIEGKIAIAHPSQPGVSRTRQPPSPGPEEPILSIKKRLRGALSHPFTPKLPLSWKNRVPQGQVPEALPVFRFGAQRNPLVG